MSFYSILAWFPSTFGDWVWINWDWHHSYCHHKLHSQPRTAQHYELPKRQNWGNGIGRKLKRQKESQTCCSFEKSRRNSKLGSLIWKNNLSLFLSFLMYETHIKKKGDIAYLKKFILALRRKLLHLKTKVLISKSGRKSDIRSLIWENKKCMILLLFLMYAGVNIDYIRS